VSSSWTTEAAKSKARTRGPAKESDAQEVAHQISEAAIGKKGGKGKFAQEVAQTSEATREKDTRTRLAEDMIGCTYSIASPVRSNLASVP